MDFMELGASSTQKPGHSLRRKGDQ